MRLRELIKRLENLEGGGGAEAAVGPGDLAVTAGGTINSDPIPITRGKMYAVTATVGKVPHPVSGSILFGPYSASASAIGGTEGGTGNDGVSGQIWGVGSGEEDVVDAAGGWLIIAFANGDITFRVHSTGGGAVTAEDVALAVKEL